MVTTPGDVHGPRDLSFGCRHPHVAGFTQPHTRTKAIRVADEMLSGATQSSKTFHVPRRDLQRKIDDKTHVSVTTRDSCNNARVDPDTVCRVNMYQTPAQAGDRRGTARSHRGGRAAIESLGTSSTATLDTRNKSPAMPYDLQGSCVRQITIA